MTHVRRQQKHVAFTQIDALALAVDPQIQIRVAAQLIEELLERIVVIVGAVIRTADDGDDEIAVLPDLLIADRRLQQMRVLVDPALKIERFAVRDMAVSLMFSARRVYFGAYAIAFISISRCGCGN